MLVDNCAAIGCRCGSTSVWKRPHPVPPLLQKLQEELRQEHEAQVVALQELGGFARDTSLERERGEQLAGVLRKLDGQAAYLAGQVARVQAWQDELRLQQAELKKQLAASEEQLGQAKQEGSKLAGERNALERQQARLAGQAAELEQAALDRLGEQTSAEKGAAYTLQDIKTLRAAVAQKEAGTAELQAAVDSAKAQAAAVAARNAQLAAGLLALDQAVADKAAGVARLQGERKARAAEIEAKTRDLDALNRRFQKLTENKQDAETGGVRDLGGVAKTGHGRNPTPGSGSAPWASLWAPPQRGGLPRQSAEQRSGRQWTWGWCVPSLRWQRSTHS